MYLKSVEAELSFEGLVLAGLPSNPQALAFVNQDREDAGATAVKEEELPEVPEEEKAKLVFRRSSNQCAVDEHTIRGIFREGLKKLGLSKQMRGLWMAIHTKPLLLPFTYDGKILTEIRAFRVVGMQGPRSVVCVHEALLQPKLAFTLELHDSDNQYSIENLKEVLDYAGRYVGFGAGRGKSGLQHAYGLFSVSRWDVNETTIIAPSLKTKDERKSK